jgi:hypothetical protein
MMPRIFSSIFGGSKDAFLALYKGQVLVDVRQIGDVVSVVKPGVCDAFVMDWLRRITLGKLTWGYRKDGKLDTSPSWDKKRPRLEELQSQAARYGEDAKFGYTELPPQGHEAREVVLIDSKGFTSAATAASQIWTQVDSTRQQNDVDEHLFYSLRLTFEERTIASPLTPVTYGHMIGIHLRRQIGGKPLVNKYPQHSIEQGMLHLFDPNVGEYRCTGSQREIMIQRLLEVYGSRIKRYSLARTKVWWGLGSKDEPYKHPDPTLPDMDDFVEGNF